MVELPIFSKKQEIVDAVRDNQVTIVVGETGSGKTTQIPVFLYEAGYATEKRRIAITQPRRIAATSVAGFVAKQLGTKLGDVVGYQIRFDDRSADSTRLKFMTDGILLQQIQLDTELNNYSVIVVDEAHERSENIDFLLGLLKDLLKRRRDLKLVVTSATIDEKRFSKFFGNAPVVNVSGRMYPVDIVWSERDYYEDQMVDAVIEKVTEIHLSRSEGDVLVFMTGRDDISKVVTGLEKKALSRMMVLPVYGELSSEDQQEIFHRFPGKRKVVVATNIAETSITVDGVVYVVDSGLIKQSNFHSETGIKSLDTVEHSQSGCEQRAGRAGRVQSGFCYRMYTKPNYAARDKFTTPEILRVSLADVVLKMENLGIRDIEGFDFIESPDPQAFHEAYETLIALGAIRRGVKGLTEIGKSMAQLPLDVRIARMVLEAQRHDCVKDVVTVAAFLSVRNVFVRPKESEREADAAHSAFTDYTSDALTFLNVWEEYEGYGCSDSWCYKNFLNAKSLREVGKIREQLFQILTRHGFELKVASDKVVVAKAVAMGLAYNLYTHEYRGVYSNVQRESAEQVHIHPSSALFRSFGTRFMVATEILKTTKVWARICTQVPVAWLPELVPHLCETTQKVVAWTPGQTTATIRTEVRIKTLNLDSVETSVSLEDAIRIQNQNIKQAEDAGHIRLTFRREDRYDPYSGRRMGDMYVATVGWRTYKTFPYSGVVEGLEYMCRVENFFNEDRATTQFTIYDFTQRAARPAERNYGLTESDRMKQSPTVSNYWETLGRTADTALVMARSAVAVKESQTTTFAEMGASRWFKCSCGGTVKVDKQEWKTYSEGGEIKVDCPHCNLSGSVGIR